MSDSWFKQPPARAKPDDQSRNRRAWRSNSRRAPEPRAKRKAGLLLLGLLIVALLIVTALLISENSKLNQLREKRAQEAADHERAVGYYASMRRQSGTADIIDKYAREYNVNPSFISAVISRESHYDEKAESSVGARGLMQIMEGTGQWIAGKLGCQDYSYDRLYEPDLNIQFGTWYLSYLSENLAGDPVMIASAYHAGLRSAKLWTLRHADDQQFLRVDEIPKEDTRDYVGKVMNAYALYYEYDNR